MSGQCFANTCWQNLSCSQNATVSIPARSSPSAKPPIPLKRSRTRTMPPVGRDLDEGRIGSPDAP